MCKHGSIYPRVTVSPSLDLGIKCHDFVVLQVIRQTTQSPCIVYSIEPTRLHSLRSQDHPFSSVKHGELLNFTYSSSKKYCHIESR